MVGASGAIFAIAGLYVILLPRIKFMIIFIPFFTLPAYVMIPLVLFVMWILSIFLNWPIGNVAHFGGFIAGIAYGLYLKMKYRRKVNALQRMFR
jgi:membrane associated rhomboid family serine protease